MLSLGFSSAVRRSRWFSDEVEIVDPELTTDRTVRWKPPEVDHHQFAIRTRGELAVRRFPESRVSQFIAFVVNRLAVHVLNGEMRSTSALLLQGLVIGREVVGSIGLHCDELIDARVADSRPVKRNHQGPPSGMRVVGIEGQLDAGLL